MGRNQMFLDTLDNAVGTILIDDFGGGLNLTASNDELKKNESIVRKNWGNSSFGAIEKVNGYTKKNTIAIGAKPIRGLFRVYLSDGTKHSLAVCNGGLYYSTDDGATWSRESASVALTETVFNTGVNYNDKFFFTNSTNNLYHYTVGTTTAAAATSKPTDPCKILLKRSDRRLLALVNSTNGSTLYYSKIDPTGTAADDWSAANDAGSIAIDGAKSEALTGGMTFGAVDVIFKDYAAFKVWGYPSPEAIRIPGSPGCAAPYSVAQGDGLGFHLAHDGIYLYDGNKFILISDPIDEIIDNINPSYVQNAFGIYRNGYYWLFYTESGQTVNQKCIVYDVLRSNPYAGKNIWYERDDLAMNCPVVYQGIGDDNELYAGTSANTGFVYRLDFSSNGDDDGADIESTCQTKYFNDGLSRIVKRFSKIHINYYLASGEVLVYWYTDKGLKSGSFSIPITNTGVKLGSFVLGTDTLSEDTETTYTKRMPVSCIGKDISLKFYHKGAGTPPVIRSAEIEYELLYGP